jgi:hypothetical protein
MRAAPILFARNLMRKPSLGWRRNDPMIAAMTDTALGKLCTTSSAADKIAVHRGG